MLDLPELEDVPLLMFNLNHDVMVRFSEDSTCRISKFDEAGGRGLVLDKKAQLLLLDALCHVYEFPSPLAGIVTKLEVGESPEQENHHG